MVRKYGFAALGLDGGLFRERGAWLGQREFRGMRSFPFTMWTPFHLGLRKGLLLRPNPGGTPNGSEDPYISLFEGGECTDEVLIWFLISCVPMKIGDGGQVKA